MNEDQKLITRLSDAEKLDLIRRLIAAMDKDFKREIFRHMAGAFRDEPNALPVVEIAVSSRDDLVKIEFPEPVMSVIIPAAHAVRLALMLMKHSGAEINQISNN